MSNDIWTRDPTAGRGDALVRPQPTLVPANAEASGPCVGPIVGGMQLGAGRPVPAGLDERERFVWNLGYNVGVDDAGRAARPPMPISATVSDVTSRLADGIIGLINKSPRSPTKAEIVDVLAKGIFRYDVNSDSIVVYRETPEA